MKVALPLAILVLCLLGRAGGNWVLFREFQAALLSVEWILLLCLTIWCATFIDLTFNRNDWLLIGLLLITLAWYCIGHTVSSRMVDPIILLASMTLGKGGRCALREDRGWKMEDGKSKLPILHPASSILIFLTGLVGLLAFSAWWHLDMSNNYYHGPRWMGLWDNPNIYGILMGAGVVLAAGLLAANAKLKKKI